MDNLRAIIMMMGITFHSAIAYGVTFQNIWLSASMTSSPLFDFFTLFTHLFRMQLFFLISGFFAMLVIKKRGLKGFLKNRTLRILLPFIIFLPILLLIIVGILNWATLHVEHLSPLMQLSKEALISGEETHRRVSSLHLWFLLNLYMFVLVLALLDKSNLFNSKRIREALHVKSIVLIMPLIIFPSFLSQGIPTPPADKFYPELWSFGLYGIFFILGAFIFLKQELLEELSRYKNHFLVSSLVLYLLFYINMNSTISIEEGKAIVNNEVAMSLSHTLLALCESYISVFASLYVLLVAKAYLNWQNSLLKLISDSSYWVYIVHLPLLFFIQFLLADMSFSIWSQFIISCSVTLFIAMSSYLLFVQGSIVGRLLNGERKKV